MGRPRSPGKNRPDDIRAPFGERVTALRQQAGMTQGELAAASGLSKVYLGTIERAEKGAGIETIEKLAHGLGVAPHELLQFDRARERPSPAESLAKRVLKLASDAEPGKVKRFGQIANLYFAKEDEPSPAKAAKRGTTRGRQAARRAEPPPS